jgi:hypothetical protein
MVGSPSIVVERSASAGATSESSSRRFVGNARDLVRDHAATEGSMLSWVRDYLYFYMAAIGAAEPAPAPSASGSRIAVATRYAMM